MPSNDFGRYHFQGQRNSEVILRVIHRHWFNIVSHFVLVFLITFLIFASFLVFPFLFPETDRPELERLFLFFQSTFLLLLWLYSFLVWIDYYFDVWIITSERVINIEQKGLFSREVSELKFSRIQDVTSIVTGMLPTMLNYGDVDIQTAAEEEHFLFRQVPDPFQVKDLLMERLRNERDEEIGRVVAAVKVAKTTQSK